MNLALFSNFIGFSRLPKFSRWLHGKHPSPHRLQPLANRIVSLSSTPEFIAPCAIQTSDKTINRHMPLRVVHVVEDGQPRSSVGRMVISGCIKDVCEELDRLVEREAALLH